MNGLPLIRQVFGEYRLQFCRQPASVAEAAGEAATIIDELIFLDERICKNHSVLVHHHLQGDEGLMAKMRAAAPQNKFLRDPNLRVDNMTVVYGAAGDRLLLPPDLRPVALELQIDATSFYERAHRLLKVLPRLPHLRLLESRPITIVRNHLVEHTDKKDGSGPLWSFGYGIAEGPRLKPIWNTPTPPTHQDQGYFLNRATLIHDLVSAMKPLTVTA